MAEFKETLELLGFAPWFAEDAMAAGAELHRSIERGMQESCAAVFFLTPAFKDHGVLRNEINYATGRKTKLEDEFAIVTLVFRAEGDGPSEPAVPPLLRAYVWKEPTNDLEALREILKAIPLQVGPVQLKSSPL